MSNSWKVYLEREARAHKMCADNRAYLSACETKEDAIRLYKQTIDWALEEQYPPLEFLREQFSSHQSNGIYIDHHFDGEILNEHQVYVFHNCTGHIRVGLNVSKSIIPMLYFANGCKMTVENLEDDFGVISQVPLYIFGKNNIVPQNTSISEFRVYHHNIKKGGAR